MRYHQVKPEQYYTLYGQIYICHHQLYDVCTLYRIKDKALCVIQQRFNERTKRTWWGEIDPWLTDNIYLNENFKAYFDKRADIKKDGYYPTVTVRQLMWSLKMKPIKKERWETVFDRKNI